MNDFMTYVKSRNEITVESKIYCNLI